MKAKGIFISALTALAALTGCNEDENIVGRTKGNELCISTTVPAITRAPIEGTQLPEHSQIGVSLLNPDGSDYDGKAQYKNVLYKSETLANGTSWSSTNPIILSPSKGKAIAYYPYSAAVADISAIPVETASQTDYLYSDWVSELSYKNPQANFAMNHALCAVQINLVNAGYTAGPGEVTQLSVASPALATTASLNANTGTLSAFAGQGDAITVDKAFTLTGEPHGTKIIAIPTAIQDNLTVKVVVDGATSTVPVTVNHPFVQGKAYVVNLKVKDAKTPVELVSVTVKDWVQEIVGDFNVSPTHKDSYILNLDIPSSNIVFKSNVKGFTGTIDWGDGTKTSHSNDNNPSHTYANAGKYTVTHIGKCSQLGYSSFVGLEDFGAKYISDIQYIGGELGINNLNDAFSGCTKITTLKDNLFENLKAVTVFQNTFRGCTSLIEIPEGLFNGCSQVTIFSYTFSECTALTEIPTQLFKDTPNVQIFDGVFNGCTGLTTIPDNFFNNFANVQTIGAVFKDCSNIKNIPVDLFENCFNIKMLPQLFSGCTSLTEIPMGLLKNCTKTVDFSELFSGCTNIASIPTGLFDSCTQAILFNGTFSGCNKITSIPTGLFDNCTKVTSFTELFSECTALRAIPNGLFHNCQLVQSFAATFRGCTNFGGLTKDPFLYCTQVTDFTETFKNCTYLSNQVYNDIFATCKNVTSFAGTFEGCTGLTSIPTNLFDQCRNVEDFSNTFKNCTKLTGEAPFSMISGKKIYLWQRENNQLYFATPRVYTDCFTNCPRLRADENIPPHWKGYYRIYN